jgi:uncharacterized protein involved in exopolysaccharide biosynthesis
MPTPSSTLLTGQTSVRDLLAVVFRQRRKVVTLFAVVFLLTIALTAMAPRVYESNAKLLVRLGRESVTLDPTASTGQVMSVRQSRDNEINSELEILSSRDLSVKVVDAIGPENLKRSGLLQRLGLVGGGDLHQQAIDSFDERLHIESLKDSNIITLSFTAGSPKLAQLALNTLITFYLDKHISAHRTSGSYEFFQRQTEDLQKELGRTESALRDLKNKKHIGMLDEQRRILLNRIGALEQEREQTRTGIAGSRAKIGEMNKIVTDLPETLITQQTSGYPNAASDSLREKIYELQLREQDLLSRYTETGAPVQEVRRQIAEARAMMNKENGERTQVTQGVNATRQSVKGEILQEKANQSALSARVKSLTSELAADRKDLITLNNTEVEVAQLERQLASQRENYIRYAASLEQARIDQALETQKISNIGIVQAATASDIPVSPRALLNLIIGVVVGLVGGVALAFGVDYLDHTFRRPSDVEEHLKLPTLVAIPDDGALGLGRLPRTALRGRPAAGSAAPTATLRRPSAPTVGPYYEALRDRLMVATNGHQSAPRVLAITGCGAGNSSNTVATALAGALRLGGSGRVLLADAGGVHHPIADGKVLLSGYEVSAVGTVDRRTPILFEGPSAKEVVDSMRSDYAYVVLDSPPAAGSAASIATCAVADGVILVVESEDTRWEVAQEATDSLQRAHANLLGVVLIRRRFHLPQWLYERL